MSPLLFARDGAPSIEQFPLVDQPAWAAVLAAASGIAWAFALELNITIFLTFKRRRGLYFWSLLGCSWGLSLHALAFVLRWLGGAQWLVYIPFVEVGWVMMVTGQALVLYSRLHLVVRKQTTLRAVLALIIIDAIVLHIPTIVLTIGSDDPSAPSYWGVDFGIMERIQLAGFCIQEFIISGIYLWSVVRVFNSIQHSSTRRVMIQLVAINALCIGMDFVLIGLEYSNTYIGEAALKPMIYAIKLKLEFVVLNQLVSLTLAGRGQVSRGRVEEYEFSSHDNNGTHDRAGPGTGHKSLEAGGAGGKMDIRNSVRRSGWPPRSPTHGPTRQQFKSFNDALARDGADQHTVSISADDRPAPNRSMWARALKRHNSARDPRADDDDALSDAPARGAVRAHTTTTIVSEAIEPAGDTGSNSSSMDKILPFPQPVTHG